MGIAQERMKRVARVIRIDTYPHTVHRITWGSSEEFI